MALNPRDVPLTRETVYGWLEEWKKLTDPPPVRDYIAAKVNALNLPDAMVNTQFHDDLDEQTSVVEMILADLPSYGIQNS